MVSSHVLSAQTLSTVQVSHCDHHTVGSLRFQCFRRDDPGLGRGRCLSERSRGTQEVEKHRLDARWVDFRDCAHQVVVIDRLMKTGKLLCLYPDARILVNRIIHLFPRFAIKVYDFLQSTFFPLVIGHVHFKMKLDQ